jgi:hypothetical protein
MKVFLLIVVWVFVFIFFIPAAIIAHASRAGDNGFTRWFEKVIKLGIELEQDLKDGM